MTTTETPDPTTHARAMTQLFALAVENELPEYLVAHLEQVAERACLRAVMDPLLKLELTDDTCPLCDCTRDSESLRASLCSHGFHAPTDEERDERLSEIDDAYIEFLLTDKCPACGDDWVSANVADVRDGHCGCMSAVDPDPNPAPPPGSVTWTVRRDGEVVGEVVAQLWHEARGLAVVEYGEGAEV